MHANSNFTKWMRWGSIDNGSALVKLMALCWADIKPLPEQNMTQFTDAQIRHQDLFSEWGLRLVHIMMHQKQLLWGVVHSTSILKWMRTSPGADYDAPKQLFLRRPFNIYSLVNEDFTWCRLWCTKTVIFKASIQHLFFSEWGLHLMQIVMHQNRYF